MSTIDMDWVHDLIERHSDHIEGNTCTFHNGAYARMAEEIAATVGNGTDLSKRLREVTGLRSFAELFGFSWEDGSDWDWHDVACAMADAIDATAGVVPETKYLMALDEAREAQRKLEMCQTSQKVYQGKCRSLKETNADLRRIIDDMKAATVGGYAITFAPTLDRPPETMVGETVYDSEGNAIGLIVNARIKDVAE